LAASVPQDEADRKSRRRSRGVSLRSSPGGQTQGSREEHQACEPNSHSQSGGHGDLLVGVQIELPAERDEELEALMRRRRESK
jgi:hypothetical protein